jgi:hypothetical protein
MKCAMRAGLACLASGALLAAAASAAASTAPTITPAPVPGADGNLTVPWDVLVAPNGETMYVSDRGLGLVAINLAQPTSTPTPIEEDGSPVEDATGLVLSPDGKTLYVSGDVNGQPGVWMADVSGSSTDPADDTITGQIADPNDLAQAAIGLALSSNGKYLYIGDAFAASSSGEASIAVADLTPNAGGSVVEDDPEPTLGDTTQFAWNPISKLLYVANFYGNVGVLKVSGNSVTLEKLLDKTGNTYGIAVSPDGRTLYTTAISNTMSYTGTTAGSTIDTLRLLDGGTSFRYRGKQTLPSNTTLTGLSFAPSGRGLDAGSFTDTTAGDPESSVGSVMGITIPPALTKLTITGSDKVGARLTADPTDASGSTLAYQWMAKGKAIAGADKKTLKVTKQLKGKAISVKVTAVSAGYAQTTLTAKKS